MEQVTLPPMQKGSKSFVIAVVIAILGIAIAAVVLRDQLRCAGFPGPAVSPDELPGEPPGEGGLRIASWNVRNFPLDERPQEDDLGYSRRTNICDFETAFGGLDADLYGLQEVNDIRRFQPILRRACGERSMDVRYSSSGGRHGQHLAIAWDNTKLELVGEPMEVQELVFEPGMRPAFAGYFRSLRAGGVDFTLVVVHLESGPKNFADRRRQNRALASWIEARIDGRAAVRRRDSRTGRTRTASQPTRLHLVLGRWWRAGRCPATVAARPCLCRWVRI